VSLDVPRRHAVRKDDALTFSSPAQPWNNIEQGTLTKMYTTQPEAFDKVYKRERL
jgi:hypothetical protein